MKPSSASLDYPADDDVPEVLYEFTPEQIAALEETRRKLNFTPQEVEERLRRTEADMEWMAAAATPGESERRAAQVWDAWVERPRARRRIAAARKVTPSRAPRTRPLTLAAPRERRDSSSSRTSGQDPGGDDGEPSDPFCRPVDQLLTGLRQLAREYELDRVYELIPGKGGEPDRWRACCPFHPAAGFTVVITELPSGEADVWCRVGCAPGVVRSVLVPDPERQRQAEAYAQVLLWAQSFKGRRAA
jgi:hypothetical protein